MSDLGFGANIPSIYGQMSSIGIPNSPPKEDFTNVPTFRLQSFPLYSPRKDLTNSLVLVANAAVALIPQGQKKAHLDRVAAE